MMRIQLIFLTLLGAILGVTAKVYFSNKANVKSEELDLLVDAGTLDRQLQADKLRDSFNLRSTNLKVLSRGKSKPKPKPKPQPQPKPPVEDPDCVVPEEGDAKNMPNVNYFMRGYNILKGNPHQVSVSSVDPGFQEAIFNRCYNDKRKTPDGLYLQPDGTLISMCQSCSLSAVTKITSAIEDYTDSLSEKVKVTGSSSFPWWYYRFSWSLDYQKILTGIHLRTNYYTHSDAHCCAYQIQTDTYTRPPFSQNFLNGVEKLPSTYDEAMYRTFIEAFGTHYIKQADMGSLFGQQTKISKESWANFSSLGWSIEHASSWSAMLASGSYNLTDDVIKDRVSVFNMYSSSQTLYTKGSTPPKSNSIEDWVHETKKYPAPISMVLGLILDLIEDNTKRENLKKALDDYSGSNSADFLSASDPWLTNLFSGERSESKSCDGGYVTWILLPHQGAALWPYDGIFDLCFKCSNDPDTMQCFNGGASPGNANAEMTCSENGFERITTYSPELYSRRHINFKAKCNRDAEPQYENPEYENPDAGPWASWVSCHGTKITGFQVIRNKWNGKDNIVNFRIKCEVENNLIL